MSQVLEWARAEIAARVMTQKALGRAIGLDEAAISKVMNGTRQLTATELVGMLRLFGYPTPWDRHGTELQRLVRLASSLTAEQRDVLADFLRTLQR